MLHSVTLLFDENINITYFSISSYIVGHDNAFCSLSHRPHISQVSQMEQEYSLKEQELDARVRELEECSRNSSADLTRLLTAQQKSTQRWKEEAKNLMQSFETKITGLK